MYGLILVKDDEHIMSYLSDTSKIEEVLSKSINSDSIASFHCPKGHSWIENIRVFRKRKHPCTACEKEKKSIFNLKPYFLEYWDYEKNIAFDIHKIGIANRKAQIHWKCPKGCEFTETVYRVSRRKKENFCPVCANRTVNEEYNFAVCSPDAMCFYDYVKNTDVDPSKEAPWSAKKVHWRCERGHKWFNSLQSMHGRKTCPKCASNGDSFPEYAMIHYFKDKLDLEVEHRKKIEGRLEADIFLEKYNLIIEYNGYFYHKNKRAKDMLKFQRFLDLGYNLILINEYRDTPYTYDLPVKQIHTLGKSYNFDFLSELSNELDLPYYEVSSDDILSCMTLCIKKNSLESTHPEIAQEWHPYKNGILKPNQITKGSNLKVWWRCSTNVSHEWSTAPSHRTGSKPSGCPYCAGNKPTLHKSLEFLIPEILPYWDYEKNTIEPWQVTAQSTIKVWWKKENGESQYISVNSKTKHILRKKRKIIAAKMRSSSNESNYTYSKNKG